MNNNALIGIAKALAGSGGGGGGGESKVEFDLTQEQIMSYVSSSKFTLTGEQLADIDVSNPPAKLIFNGELGANKMTICLSLLSSESFVGFEDSLSYGLIGGQGEAYHVVRSFTCLISISDGAATSGWVDFNLIMKSPDTEGTNGQVLTTDGQGGVSWTTPSSGDGGNYYIYFTKNGDTATCDKTFDEIEAAYDDGKNIVAINDPSNMGFAERFGYIVAHVKNAAFTFLMQSSTVNVFWKWEISQNSVTVTEIKFALET